MTDGSWWDHAACRGWDTSLFFPVTAPGVEAARAICQGCPVRGECLEYALDRNIDDGVWGGQSERTRRRIRAARRRGAAEPVPPPVRVPTRRSVDKPRPVPEPVIVRGYCRACGVRWGAGHWPGCPLTGPNRDTIDNGGNTMTDLAVWEQMVLLDPAPLTNPIVDPSATHAERFAAFHQANPHVFDNLARLALDLKARGASRVGIGMLFEVLRWQYALRTAGDDYRLNNNHRAFYARKLMAEVPDLAGMFEVREQRSA